MKQSRLSAAILISYLKEPVRENISISGIFFEKVKKILDSGAKFG
jgi:hypothetical protein